MGGFDPAQLKASFAIPDDHVCRAMIAIGHPARPDTLSDERRAREEAPRERLPLAECFFEGAWGEAIKLS